MTADKPMSIGTVIGRKDQKPYVVLTWGAEGGQLTPGQARQLGLEFVAAAASAEADAFMLAWLVERATPEATAALLKEFHVQRAPATEPKRL